jgi:hypothetical protein
MKSVAGYSMLSEITMLQWAIGAILTVVMGFIVYILNGISKKLDQSDAKTTLLNTVMTGMKTEMAGIKTEIVNVKAAITGLETKIAGVETKLEAKIDRLSSTVTNLRVAFGTLLGSLNGPSAFSAVQRLYQPSIEPPSGSISGQGAQSADELAEPRPE